ncbi:MAG: hypothetical protein KJ970_04920 [Candidatus Eisenbacteria bacterium]|uniref:Uncharacterized protein n=1 Tax=Eiseniibacteriota bacterium TaxID=2212470 RepID=A0A948W5Q0_UNCEI|nr:hypothetical protein [Candidatus Eisenbacteria bacterium]MBU1947335.1 hypothetical protein [Candidatus Eisenbacteria bacterium]MBU2690250.1 hypothetical protein [Candidatus Eisenbacteria bacterium]
MLQTIGTILGIPKAIDATLSLIDRARAGKDVPGALDDAKRQLESVKGLLGDFAVSFDELYAWKRIHHISNTLSNNFKTSLDIIGMAEDEDDFDRICKGEYKKDIKRDLDGLDEPYQAGPLLHVYKAQTHLHIHVKKLTQRDDDGKEWHDRTQLLIESIKMAVKEGGTKKTYRALKDLRRHINVFNTWADDELVKGIERYNEVISELQNMLNIQKG